MERMRGLVKIEPGLVVLLILVTVFWAPAIFEHKSIIHGDFYGHSLPLMDLHSRALHDFGQLLWQDKTYGGHPLFAEGQGGFAHPVNMFFAWVVAPLFGVVTAENLFHWFCMMFGGAGILLIGRQLGLGPGAACFGAVAGVFSLYNLNQQQNETVSAAAAWISWCIWATGRWLDRPTLQSAALLGSILTLEFFCGYPEALDGALLYGLMMLAVRAFDPAARANWGRGGRVLIATGAVGAVITLGLSAVQLLPELELIGQSHRHGGTPITYHVPLAGFVRGFLFTRWEYVGPGYYQVVGSILVCMLATVTLIARTTNAMKGHIAGTLLLILLGMGEATALFRFIYDHDLLPQLHFYRLVFIYLNDANVTVAVLAAIGVEAVCRWLPAADHRLQPGRVRPPIWLLGLFLSAWAWVVYAFYLPGMPIVHYGIAAAAIIAVAACVPLRTGRWLAAGLTVLLVIEIAATKLFIFHFADQALLARPGSVATIQAEPDWRDYRIYSDSRAGPYSFIAPNAPGLEEGLRYNSPGVAGLANLRWDLRSIDGALALGLGRRWTIEQRIEDEAFGRVDQPPGARLIDLLGIRWIVFGDPVVWAPAVRTLWHPEGGLSILQNDAARPRFQIFPSCRRVSSTDQALDLLTTLKKPTLVIEDQSATDPCSGQATDAAEDAPPATFTVRKAKSTRYRFDISAERPAWFFLADANYPGWKAYLDGKEVPVYSAQILGKAVSVPEGRHDLRIRFRPMSFYIGLTVSVLTALITGAALIRARRAAKPR
jgi:hypothetical protein